MNLMRIDSAYVFIFPIDLNEPKLIATLNPLTIDPVRVSSQKVIVDPGTNATEEARPADTSLREEGIVHRWSSVPLRIEPVILVNCV